jgi:hypothetical protein
LTGTPPFTLAITDAQRKGGHDFIYRLYIRPPLPDFVMRVVPSCIIARPGATVPIAVHAMRKYFDDDIDVSLVDAPAGFKLDGAVVPRGVEKVPMTLTVPNTASEEPVLLEMDGSARRRKLSRPAVPAESMMQAFLWLQIVPAEQWAVILSGKPVNPPPFEFLARDRIRLKLGEETRLEARITGKWPPAKEVHVELSDPPKGITIEQVSPESPGLVVVLATDAETVEPGLTSNLVFEAFREYTPAATESNPSPQPRRTSLGYLPAVPFEVVGRAPRR